MRPSGSTRRHSHRRTGHRTEPGIGWARQARGWRRRRRARPSARPPSLRRQSDSARSLGTPLPLRGAPRRSATSYAASPSCASVFVHGMTSRSTSTCAVNSLVSLRFSAFTLVVSKRSRRPMLPWLPAREPAFQARASACWTRTHPLPDLSRHPALRQAVRAVGRKVRISTQLVTDRAVPHIKAHTLHRRAESLHVSIAHAPKLLCRRLELRNMPPTFDLAVDPSIHC